MTTRLINDLSLFDTVKDLATLRRLTKDLDIRYLASGSFSEVLSLKVGPKHQLALKFAALESESCEEWTLAEHLNKLIKGNQGPHFIYSYKILTFTNRSYCLIQDKADFDLASICNANLSKGVQVSLFVQLMMALHTIQSRYQIAHRDIKAENIYLTALHKPIKVTYKTDLRTFTVTLEGYWLYLGDFNVSYSFHPRYSPYGLLGERNAKLFGTTLIPIRTRNVHNNVINWSSGLVTNRITLRTDMTFTRHINAHDPNVYPPFEFIDDIVDACRTFIGGPRCLLNLYHSGLTYPDDALYEPLSSVIFTEKSFRVWTFDVNKGYLCSAALLLDKVWEALGIRPDIIPDLHYNLKGLTADR